MRPEFQDVLDKMHSLCEKRREESKAMLLRHKQERVDFEANFDAEMEKLQEELDQLKAKLIS